MHYDAPDPTREGDADALFAEFLELERAGQAPELEQFCERHPEQAEELRLRHSQWRKAGAALERLRQAGVGPEEQPGERADAAPEARARAELLWARYKVQGEVGRGGMGYILEVRDQGLDRDLAMKLLRGKGGLFGGMEDGSTRKDERARFLEEARITGRLEHPGIVPVHELGRDPEGKPYFTMKLVAGRTFREILPLAREEREDWNMQRALGVLLKVCEALGFAHDKGVIHRDLKPANLMVGSFGEVYVMDWGLARDLNRPEPEPKPEDVSSDTDTQDFRTLDGDVIGTPEYMSPEQATGRREEVGPLSDVFAVGAMLYELLCGRAPHGVRGSNSPVMRLAAAIGSNHEPVEELAPETPAELCAICERALAPDPEQRYASMVELAEDLRAYLEGRVVRAHATGAWQEARKWVQRNKPLAASLAAAVLLLVVGLVTALYLGEEAQANFELAEERAKELASVNSELEQTATSLREQTGLAEERASEAEEERGKAAAALEREEQRAAELEEVTEFQQGRLAGLDPESMGLFLRQGLRGKLREREERSGRSAEETEALLLDYDRWVAGADFTGLGLETLAAQILEPALEEIEESFGDQPRVRASLLETVATTARGLGLLELAEAPQREALATRRQVQGDEHQATLTSISNLGGLLNAQGKPSEAEPLYREALETSRRVLGNEHPNALTSISNMGYLLQAQGKLSEAEALSRDALEARRRVLGNEHPDTLISINNLGYLLQAQGKLSEAEPLYREALDAMRRVHGDEHPDTLASIGNLGRLLKEQGKLSEAEPYFREALEAMRRVHGDEHPSTLISINNLSTLLRAQGKLSEAEPFSREALETSRRVLGDEHPNTLISFSNMGFLLQEQGKLSEAEPYFRKALDAMRRVLGDEHPDTLISMGNLGTLLQEQGKLSEAEPLYREALEARRRVLGNEHPHTLISIGSLGTLLQEQGKLSEAEPYLREALETSRRVHEDEHPSTLNSINNLGTLLLSQGKLSEAEPYFREALKASRRVRGNEHPNTLASIHNLGTLLQEQGKLSEAEPFFREALETSRRVQRDDHPYTAHFLRGQHGILLELERSGEARTLLTDFLATTDLPEDHPLHVEVRGQLDAMESPPSDEGD